MLSFLGITERKEIVMSTPHTKWLEKPYYLAPDPPVTMLSTVRGWPADDKTEVVTAEQALQDELQQALSVINEWLNPDYNTFLPARTLDALINDYIGQAIRQIMFFPTTGIGVKVFQLGTKYGRLQMNKMKQIDSGDGKTSVWDAWISMTAPVK